MILAWGVYMKDVVKHTGAWYFKHVVWTDICNKILPRSQWRAEKMVGWPVGRVWSRMGSLRVRLVPVSRLNAMQGPGGRPSVSQREPSIKSVLATRPRLSWLHDWLEKHAPLIAELPIACLILVHWPGIGSQGVSGMDERGGPALFSKSQRRASCPQTLG